MQPWFICFNMTLGLNPCCSSITFSVPTIQFRLLIGNDFFWLSDCLISRYLSVFISWVLSVGLAHIHFGQFVSVLDCDKIISLSSKMITWLWHFDRVHFIFRPLCDCNMHAPIIQLYLIQSEPTCNNEQRTSSSSHLNTIPSK